MLAVVACSEDDAQPRPTTTSLGAGGSGGGGAGGGGGASGGGGEVPDPSAICTALDLPALPFADGPYGAHRGDVAADFTLPLVDGSAFHYQEAFSGCESYVFVPDRLTVSDLDETS